MSLYRVDAPRLKGVCAGVLVEDGVVVGGAPFFRRFFGQPLTNLVRWVSRYGGTVEEV